MKQIAKKITLSYPEKTTSPSIELHYYESDKIFIIVDGKRGLIEIPQCNVLKLIAMLQSVSCGIR